METTNKIRLGWIAFIFVAFHCGMIIIYAFPYQFVPKTLKTVSSGYVYPVFEQTWSLFAPCPLNEQQLWVKYYFEDDSTDWMRPAEKASKLHGKFRFTHHGELVLGESNLLYWVSEDLKNMNISLYKPFPVDSTSSFENKNSYHMVRRYLFGNAIYLFDKKPLRAIVECTFENVKTREEGVLELPDFNWKK